MIFLFFFSSRLCTKADAYNALIFFRFFVSSLIIGFSYLRFFLVLTASVTFFFCEFVWVTCVGIYSCCLSLCGGGSGSSVITEICQGPCPRASRLRGGALLITPDVKRFVGRRRLAVVALGEALTAAVRSVLGGDIYRTLAPCRLGRGCSITSSLLLPSGLRPGLYSLDMRTILALMRSCS